MAEFDLPHIGEARVFRVRWMHFAMAEGATRDDTYAVMRTLQNTVEELGAKYEAEHGANPVKFALAEIGGTSGRGLAGQETKDADQLGSIAIELIDQPAVRDWMASLEPVATAGTETGSD